MQKNKRFLLAIVGASVSATAILPVVAVSCNKDSKSYQRWEHFKEKFKKAKDKVFNKDKDNTSATITASDGNSETSTSASAKAQG